MEKIKNIIEEREQKNFRFLPDRQFYDLVGIKQKRWGQLYRGEVSPTIDELKAIAEYFEVPVTELI